MARARLRMTTRWAMMATVIIAAVLAQGPSTDPRAVYPIVSAVGAYSVVASMRRPLLTLFLILMIYWQVMPFAGHPAPSVIRLSFIGCFVAWALGAPAGWCVRVVEWGRRTMPDRAAEAEIPGWPAQIDPPWAHEPCGPGPGPTAALTGAGESTIGGNHGPTI